MSQPRKKTWGSIDEAVRHLGKDHDTIVQHMIPLSYHDERKQGHIRFRVLAVSKRRVARLWWEDVLAMSNRKRLN
jgi:hypothetical protein